MMDIYYSTALLLTNLLFCGTHGLRKKYPVVLYISDYKNTVLCVKFLGLRNEIKKNKTKQPPSSSPHLQNVKKNKQKNNPTTKHYEEVGFSFYHIRNL